jgi:glucokinase
MSPQVATRHLGLDLGATNLKWAMVEQAGDIWATLAREQVATRLAGASEDVPAAVVAQLGEVAAEAIRSCGPATSVGIGVPGLYDPKAGTARFLVNVPGPWAGQPIAGPVGETVGLPAALVNDARAFGLAELRLGAGRGASSMIGLTLGTGVGGVIAIDGRVHQGHDGTAGEIGHQTIDPDGPLCGCGNHGCVEAFARADRIAAACGTATAEEAVARARAGDARAIDGLAQIGRYLGIGIANMIAVISPDRVVIGGGIGAAASDLLFEPIRAELRLRVRTTALDRVELVPAELGTWAGAIGAAIHGAEAAAVTGADR